MLAKVLVPGKDALASVLGKLKDMGTLAMAGGKCACTACNSCTCACRCGGGGGSSCNVCSCSCGKCRHHPDLSAAELAWN